jgi:hypothetical protein
MSRIVKLTSSSITFEVKLPSACSFIVDGLAEHRQQNARPSTIKLHADGNLTSKVIEQN